MNKLHDVVEILKAAGWKDNCDAQWDGIEAALPELAALFSCNPPAVAVPDVLEQLQLAETEVTNAKTWSAGEQAKTHCKYALTAIAVARAQLSAAQKPEGV